jgi:hypothetical protein
MNVPLLLLERLSKLNCTSMLELLRSVGDGLLISQAMHAVLVASLVESSLKRARCITSSIGGNSSSLSVAVGPLL